MFGTISHERHRLRRNAITPFFSTASLRKLEPLIQDNISRLLAVFRRYQSTGEVLPIRPAFSALTSDVITEYCFGISENYIEAKDFNALVLETTDKLTDNMHVTVQWPWLPVLLNKLPDKFVEAIFGEGMATFHVLRRVSNFTYSGKDEGANGEGKHSEEKIKETIRTRDDYSDVKHRTIFHDLMDSKTLPEEDKSVVRFVQEAQLLLVAGTVTTATALASAIVYLLFIILVNNTCLPFLKKAL